MAPKRKDQNTTGAPVKASRESRTSTPGPVTHRDSDNDQAPDLNLDFDENVTGLQQQKEEELARQGDKFVNLWAASGLPSQSDDQGDQSEASTASQRYFGKRDFSQLPLKSDHRNRPLWIDSERKIVILERWGPLSEQATDFLVTIAEPHSRPTFLHEYSITAHSLYAAVSVGLNSKDIIETLDRFLKTELPPDIRTFITSYTTSYGKVKLVLKRNKYFVESTDFKILQMLLKDEVIGRLRLHDSDEITKTGAPRAAGVVIPGTKDAAGVQQAGLQKTLQTAETTEKGNDTDIYAVLDDDEEEKETVHAFEIPDVAVETVQKRCLELSYPILEEYDFRYDTVNADLDIDLRPSTQIRPYQEKGLSKMFGNGRAKSGIIVLPCGAGKTLLGITAACTIKKGVIVLCNSSVSAIQWRQEFLKWSNISPDSITTFTADNKDRFSGSTGVIVTTYSMVTNNRERSRDSKRMMDFLQGREWGLMLLDEVHVAPANIFRRVISSIKAHSKLGLTATLLREDDKIPHLNFLIGPKLFEADWMELSEQGYIAKVQCAEVWCPMPIDFYGEYRNAPATLKRTLCAINPRKFQACQYLINYHESRGDKIIVFSDELYALKLYALKLDKPFIYGGTGQEERVEILENFQHNPLINTLFLSKIGDTSLDLPEATCLIQISSHFGSRRQEAQRLGRILRAKRRNDEGFNAFFYSLVSKDTQEMFYSSKRQAFLVDQGYAFKVITRLAGMDEMPGLAFSTEDERRELLQRALADDKVSLQEEEADGMSGVKGRRNTVKTERQQSSKKASQSSGNAKGNPFIEKMNRERERNRRKA